MKLLSQLIIATILLFGIATPVVASAHEVEKNGTISALLHIPPDHHPVAGKKAEVDLIFADTKHVFSLQHCKCTLAVVRDEKILKQVPIEPTITGAEFHALGYVTFPDAGEYELRVSGTATDKSFSGFELEYSAKAVAAHPDNKSKAPEIAMLISASLVAIAVIVYASLRGRRSQ